jgi:hypothetical protein
LPLPSVLTNPVHWIVVAVTIAVVCASVILHYEVLGGAWRPLRLLGIYRRRRMLGLILIILVTHIAEVWIFALGYYGLARIPGVGTLEGLARDALSEYAYFSAITYTTLGFGDVVPTGALRFLTGMEALTGFVLVTWSASFAFIEMQRHWRSD